MGVIAVLDGRGGEWKQPSTVGRMACEAYGVVNPVVEWG